MTCVLSVQGMNGGLLNSSPWPSFRGDANNFGRSIHIGPQTNYLKWVFTSQYSVSTSPSIGVNGTLYFGSGSNVVAISSAGKFLWSFLTQGNVIYAPSISNDGNIYVAGGVTIYALFANGTMRWNFFAPNFIYGTIAVACDGSIRVIDKNNGGYLYAFSSKGNMIWKRSIYALSIDMVIDSNSTVYLTDFNVRAFKALNATGGLTWTSLGIISGSLQTFSRDLAGTFYLQDTNAAVKLVAISRNTGIVKWNFEVANVQTSTSCAIAPDGTIYIGGYISQTYPYPNYVYAIDNNGTLKWTYTYSPSVAGTSIVPSSIVVGGDGTIYVSSNLVIYALTSEGSLVWQHNIVAYKDSLVIGSDGTLYVIGQSGISNLFAFHDPLPTASPTVRPSTPTSQPSGQPTG